MEIRDVAEAIKSRIDLLEVARHKLKTYATERAETMVEYDKQIMIHITKLKHGQTFNVDGLEVGCTNVTGLKDIAKGLCAQYALGMSKAEARYRNCSIQIEAIKAELNAYQSIYRGQINI